MTSQRGKLQLVMVRSTREPVCHDVGLALDVLDIEIEVGEHILPASLASGQHRLCLEELERLVIGAHHELASMQVVAPGSQRLDDGQQLLLVDGVASLRICHLLRQEGDWLQAIALVLLQHCADGESRCIRVHDEGKAWVRQDENRPLGNRSLQVDECGFGGVAHSNLTLSLVSSDRGAAMALKSRMNFR